MCTVSFVPRIHGFYLAMNRDESVQRPIANPPRIFLGAHQQSLYPSEPSGGSWIGINDRCLCLALINWHSADFSGKASMLSRGMIVPALLADARISDLSDRLGELPLKRLAPFRLIAICPTAREVRELRWDLTELVELTFGWKALHWFSSGFDEAAVQHQRDLVCREAWKKSNAGTLRWLRALHRSHAPVPGPLSICMHGLNAATVSYTEIITGNAEAAMRYQPGLSCRHGKKRFAESISLRTSPNEPEGGFRAPTGAKAQP
ncbi:MAG: NRDE family protein [Chthoniobacterales bacterium]